MIKKTAGRKSTKPRNLHKAASNGRNGAFAAIESYLPVGSRERTAAGIAAAAGGALLAAAALGVGPAALAGAAGYFAYRGMSRERKTKRPVSLPISIDKRNRSGARVAPNGYQQTQ